MTQNTGNVTLANVQVEDPLVGLDATLAELAVGTREVFTESYVVTQADVDAGQLFNRVVAVADAPDGSKLRDVATVTLPPTLFPAISLEKVASPSDLIPPVGGVITYTITVENTGNVSLADVQVRDPLVGLDTTVPSLAVAERLVFVEAYTVTAADVAAGEVLNTATVTGRSPTGANVTDSDSVGVPQSPGAITGTVYLDVNGNDLVDSGDRRLAGYTVELVNSDGDVIGETTTDEDGNYAFPNITSRQEYSVVFRTPSGVEIGRINGIEVGAGVTIVDQNQPIDPRGIIYDSITRAPIAGVTLVLASADGTPLPNACLLPGQQGQVQGG